MFLHRSVCYIHVWVHAHHKYFVICNIPSFACSSKLHSYVCSSVGSSSSKLHVNYTLTSYVYTCTTYNDPYQLSSPYCTVQNHNPTTSYMLHVGFLHFFFTNNCSHPWNESRLLYLPHLKRSHCCTNQSYLMDIATLHENVNTFECQSTWWWNHRWCTNASSCANGPQCRNNLGNILPVSNNHERLTRTTWFLRTPSMRPWNPKARLCNCRAIQIASTVATTKAIHWQWQPTGWKKWFEHWATPHWQPRWWWKSASRRPQWCKTVDGRIRNKK